MENRYRPSLERHNAPYRGVSSREDSVNFDLAVMHDLFHLEKISGTSNQDGHQQDIQNNLTAILSGEKQAKSSIPTAGTMVSVLEKIQGKQDLTLWTGQNGARITASGEQLLLESDGKQLQSGVSTIVNVNPGDILSIRFKATMLKGQGVQFAIGAKNFDNDGDELKIADMETFATGQYIEKRLYCRSRQEVQVVLYLVHQIMYEQPVSLRIEDFSLSLLSETPVGLIGTDSSLKKELEKEENYLAFLEERITNKNQGGI